MAQKYSEKCQWRHSVEAYSGQVGENLYKMQTSAHLTVEDAANPSLVMAQVKNSVNQWWAEKANYNYAKNSCASGKKCGHYTQVDF